ncbi:hypothetical protein [Frisingicoccus sp.]|uniref:hypothetical protein n=1 Tax=Frisingicoccus sp. TaxID=1918627 RepID=UPI003AB1CB96
MSKEIEDNRRKEKRKFFIRVTVAHTVTYIIFGMIFSQIFSYQNSLSSAGMRDMNSLIVGLAPLFQIVRGLLFAIVLWLIRDVFLGKRYGWLKVWIILVILGIFNTPGTAPGSIEGFIYLLPTSAPLSLQIGGLLEIVLQTLVFSILVTFRSKGNKNGKGKGKLYPFGHPVCQMLRMDALRQAPRDKVYSDPRK